MDAGKTIDMIQELRMRCWAREHYVPLADRDEFWHPIILDEMSTRDKELSVKRPVHFARRSPQLSRRVQL